MNGFVVEYSRNGVCHRLTERAANGLDYIKVFTRRQDADAALAEFVAREFALTASVVKFGNGR